MVDQQAPAASRRSRTRMVVQAAVSLVLIVVIFYFLLKKIDLAQVWSAITSMTWLELTILGLLAVWNLCTYAMLGSWGYSRSRATTAVLVSGVWNSFIKLGMPVLALALVALQGGATGGRATAALFGIA